MESFAKFHSWTCEKFGRKGLRARPAAPKAKAKESKRSVLFRRRPVSKPKKAYQTSAYTCTFFFQLPTEIRFMIYRLAFGDRIVHMGLQTDSLNFDPMYIRSLSRLQIEPGSPMADILWNWWNSECPQRPRGDPRTDHCQKHLAEAYLSQSRPSGESALGALGWLLSCRLAYNDAIDILYGSNTISTSSKLLMNNFPALVPPANLSRITSLELNCHLYLLDGPRPMREDGHQGWPAFESILKIIESHFQSLRHLSVAIQAGDSSAFPGHKKKIPEQDLERFWKIADRIAQNFGPQLRKFVLAPQASVFHAIEDEAQKDERPLLQLDGDWIRRTIPSTDPTSEQLSYTIRKGAGDYMTLRSLGLDLNIDMNVEMDLPGFEPFGT